MVRQASSQIVIGWRVNRELASIFLLFHNAGTCNANEKTPCFCGDMCWKVKIDPKILPPNFTLSEFRPYAECDNYELEVVLEYEHEPELSFYEMSNCLNQEHWGRAQVLATRLGSKENQPSIFAMTHVM